jgi:hypothetical protein
MRFMKAFILAIGALSAGPVTAMAVPVRFEIPAQPAPAALMLFARQAGTEVVFSADDLKTVRANEVVGEYEPAEALARLLRGTGFTARRHVSGKFVVAAERVSHDGRLCGSVVKSGGAEPVAGATLRLAGTALVATTDRHGEFLLAGVPVGRHTAVALAPGFGPTQVNDVVIAAGRKTEVWGIVLAPVRSGEEALQLDAVQVSASALSLGPTGALVFAMEEVIVTPSRYGLEQERGLVAASLTSGDLRVRPQLGGDLYRLLSRLPGITANDYSARFWVRGAPHGQLLARLDGVDLLEPFHYKDTGGSFSVVDLETIGSLNLYTGGFTSEYGDRLGGVLAMETDQPMQAQARTTFDSSLAGTRANSRGRLAGGRGRWLIGGRTGFPYLATRWLGDRDTIQPSYHDLMGKVEFDLTPDHTLSVHALQALDRTSYQETNEPQLVSHYRSDYSWVRWRGSLTDRLKGESLLSYSRHAWRRNGAGSYNQHYRLDLRDDVRLNVTGLRQDWTTGVSDRALVRAGFELKSSEADYDYQVVRELPEWRNGRIVTGLITRDFRLKSSATTAGGFLAGRFQPNPALTVEAGGRYDRNDLTNDSDASPRITAAYEHGRTTWRAAWGYYHQAHGLHQLAVQDGDPVFRRSERAEHRVVGVEHRLPSGLKLRLEGYERRTARPRPHWDNLIDYDFFPEVQDDRARFDPLRNRARGVEVLAENRSGKRLAWSASYALARAEETLPGGVTVAGVQDQRHTFYLDAAFTLNPRWQFSFAWQYHSGLPATPITRVLATLPDGTTVFSGFFGPRYSIRLPEYHRLDLRVQRSFPLRRGVGRVYLDVFNIYDRKNIVSYSFLPQIVNGQLTTVRAGGDVPFPVLPNIGAAWEF